MTNNNSIQIPTNAHSNVLENTLTQDITTLEAIYDLIDNSIDAARRDIFTNKNFTADDYGMPQDYSGYSIEVVVNDKEISIVDNCLGFSKDELENKSLIVGQSSNHEFGIGQYGVGLKRSLLKIGDKYTLNTDDKKNRFKINFTNKDINSQKGFISSFPLESHNKKMTALKINNLKQDILPDIKSNMWYENAIEGMNQRYTIYLEKGLIISIKYFENESKKIRSSLVKLRYDSRFKSFKKNYKLNKDVTVIISAGIHSKYKFKGELGYSLSENRKITNEYGIYIICNDRVIVASSKEKMHGWKTNWHSEYNGFVCIVRFISKNPSLLPINTAKTAIQADSAIFLEAASKIHPIAEDYRKNIRLRYSDGYEEVQLGASLYDDEDDIIYEEEDNKDTEINHQEHTQVDNLNGKHAKKKEDCNVDTKSSESNQLNLPHLTNGDAINSNNKPLQTKDLTKIPVSNLINQALIQADIRKLTQLYNSICTLSLKSHGSIVVIALSVFYESLGTYLGKKIDQDIHSFFNQNTITPRTNEDYTKNEFKEISNAISYIHKEANSIKHNKDYRMETAVQMIPILEKLERVTADMLSHYAFNKNDETN